tara:strand:+ start:576 stop:1430 length:855 start_codon:yes stop_codon:yes gene_type:complete
MFDVKGHIKSREARHGNANIQSKDLPGLATIELNITELCNRTCSFCPRHDPEVYPNKKEFMELDTVSSLTQQLIATDWYGDIHITGFGEPHTHPKLNEIIAILRKANVYIEVTTNGDRLIDSDIDYAVKLFKSGLDLITVDCYDGDMQYKQRKNKMLDTFQDLYDWRLRNHYDDGNAQSLIEQYGFNNRAGTMGGSGIQNPCYLPFYKTMVDWNGDITLCCNDWHREAGNMGNILVDGFINCWNSDKLIWIRKQLAKGKRGGVCASCSIKGTKFGSESVEVWQM